ncbi:Atrial natriuretic peptide receptor 1 [Hypsibius exemplaris]|uniref:guanylate cyclase n=1 Tax=Hypsibius exemplaris TaxID=2072580 RepID=A0A1W0WFS4_HYPEX|nr:Atrial natriuretic peptide receptor 1 [Hypsibius exemplaris]
MLRVWLSLHHATAVQLWCALLAATESITIGISYLDQVGSPLDYRLIKPAIECAKKQMDAHRATVVILEKFHQPCKKTEIYYDFSKAIDDVNYFLGTGMPQQAVQIILGSPCTQEFLAQAALSSYSYKQTGPTDTAINVLPTMIFTGGAPLALHIDQFKYAFRVSYSTATQWDMFFQLCVKYAWVHVTVVLDENDPESSVIGNDFATLARGGQRNLVVSSVPFSENRNWHSVLDIVESKSRVVILLTDSKTTREIMLVAITTGRCDGSFAFFNFDPIGDKYVRNTTALKNGDDTDAKALSAFKSLHIFSLKRITQAIPGWNSDQYGKPSYWQISHYNAFKTAVWVWTYWNIINTGLLEDATFKSQVLQQGTIDYVVDDVTPKLFLNKHGDLFSKSMDMYELNPSSEAFEPVASYDWTVKNGTPQQRLIFASIPMWSSSNKPPPDEPQCGFDGKKCAAAVIPVEPIITGLSAGSAAVFFVVLAVYLYRQYRRARQADLAWLLKWEDLLIPVVDDRDEREIRVAAMRTRSHITGVSSKQSVEDVRDRGHTNVLPYGVYWKKVLYMTRLSPKYRLALTTKVWKDIRRVSHLADHDNVAKFIGACLEPDHVMVLYEYCAKGSLQDLLADAHFKLDWTVRFSFLHDIVKALFFIHLSSIACHGRLTSRCCFVDSRFVLKLTDYGLNSFFELSVAEQWATKRNANYFVNMLWTAPEHIHLGLSYGSEAVKEPTKPGDIYSFGIILQETILRLKPFGMFGAMSPEDIVNEIRKPNKGEDESDVSFRPILPEESANPGLIDLAKKCWSHNPYERPSVKYIRNTMRALGKTLGFGGKATILDTLLVQMEELTVNLQSVIEERGRILLNERTGSQELLYRLLPKAFAERLALGETVHPQIFSSCSILIFNISNFSKLMGDCSVLQLTEFFLEFHQFVEERVLLHDCVKLDFHNQTGTVASGVPRPNDKNHAPETAKLALRLIYTAGEIDTCKYCRSGEPIKLAIAIHTGSCVAGVIGEVLPRFCLFGETVQIAQRILEHADVFHPRCSSATKSLLDSDFELVQHGDVFVKGKGIIVCFSICGVTGDPELSVLQHHHAAAGGGNLRSHRPTFL